MSSKLKLVEKLRNLASDPSNQTFLIKEADCVPSLLVFLDTSKEEEVLLTALQTIYFLASNHGNREALAKYPKLVSHLVEYASNDELDHENMRHFAKSSLKCLEAYINGKADKTEKKPHRPRELHLTELYLKEMISEKTQKRIEHALLALKGVVSITFKDGNNDQKLGIKVYCTIRGREQKMLDMLDSIDVAAFLSKDSTQNEQQQETKASNLSRNPFLSYKATANIVSNAGKSSRTTQNAALKFKVGTSSALHQLTPQEIYHFRTAVTQHSSNVEDMSLAGRLARQRKMKEEAKQSYIGSFFGRLTSYIW